MCVYIFYIVVVIYIYKYDVSVFICLCNGIVSIDFSVISVIGWKLILCFLRGMIINSDWIVSFV